MKSIRCILGFHTWSWRLQESNGVIKLNTPPPKQAKCTRCGVKYSK